MTNPESVSAPQPRLTLRSLSGLLNEAWQRRQRRQRRTLGSVAAAIAAGAVVIAIVNTGGDKPGRIGLTRSSAKPNAGGIGSRGFATPTHVTFLQHPSNSALPVGETEVIKVQLLDRSNRPVRRAGVPIRIGQVIWSETGPTRARAIINGKPTGHSSIAITNAQGTATFTVTGTKASRHPTSLTALILKDSPIRYGASGQLQVAFSARRN